MIRASEHCALVISKNDNAAVCIQSTPTPRISKARLIQQSSQVENLINLTTLMNSLRIAMRLSREAETLLNGNAVFSDKAVQMPASEMNDKAREC